MINKLELTRPHDEKTEKQKYVRFLFGKTYLFKKLNWNYRMSEEIIYSMLICVYMYNIFLIII